MRMATVRTLLGAAGLLGALAPAAVPLHAQGVRKDDMVFNSRGVPLAGATVRVCAMPASGQPCSPLAQIYSNVALTQALVNPTTTDGLGNYYFYAAPGRYMVEISGPGITTRQIPDVILPSDPTSPSFSSLSSSGGISAFSLSLTGNLAVSGNASAGGTLSAGSTLSGNTLNVTNQAASPGAAPAGTVNIYTKNDKKLYYSDETGTETGPIANTTGVQTNVSNTFTAAQNFDADVAMKGPNPWFDLRRFGGYASMSPPSSTGSIAAGSTTLALVSAIDFANGQGIVVDKAGAATSLATPTSPTVAPGGILNGTTTYTYQVVAEDYAGGLTAASATGATTTGAAALGATSVNVTQCVRSGGWTTFTTSAAHNFAAGQTVSVTGFNAGNGTFLDACNGTFYIMSTPTSTTFTISQSGLGNTSDSSGGTAQVNAYNKVSWNYQPNVLRYWIYRGGALVGVSIGLDSVWYDYEYDLQTGILPAYLPLSAPSSPQNGYLATTIVSGGGTTTLTLASAAISAASTTFIFHDNSTNLVNAVNAAINAGGGTVYFPATQSRYDGYPFNAVTQLTTDGLTQVRLLFDESPALNQPLVLGSSFTIEGLPKNSGPSQFLYDYATRIYGTGFPMIYVNASPYKKQQYYKHVEFYATYNQQTGVYFDENTAGGGAVGILFDDASFTGGAQSYSPLVIKGGFDYWFHRGVFNMLNAPPLSQPAVRFKNSSPAVCGASCQVSYLVRMSDTTFVSAGLQIDNVDNPNMSGGAPVSWDFSHVLYESGAMPLLRVLIESNVWTDDYTFTHVVGADPAAGVGTALVDMSGSTNVGGVRFEHCTAANNGQPLIAGTAPSPDNLLVINSTGILSVPAYVTTMPASSNPELGAGSPLQGLELRGASPVLMTGNSFVGTSLPYPGNPPTLTTSAGGAVPAGTMYYAYSVVGWNGGESPLSPMQSVTVASGMQTVNLTCSYTGSTNIKGFNFYRGTAPYLYRAHAVPGGSPMSSTCSYTDTFSFADGIPPSVAGYASSDFLGGSSVSADTLRVNGELLSAAPRSVHNVFLPGALTSAWSGATLTLDRAITVTRVQVQTKTAPSGCTTNAVIRLTDGTTPVALAVSAAANDSGAISQNYAAGAALTVAVQTPASGCSTAPADANVIIQYRMQ